MSLVNLPNPRLSGRRRLRSKARKPPTATHDFQELEKNNPRRREPLKYPRKSNCGSRLPGISQRERWGRQEPGAPFTKLQAVFP